MDAWGRFFFVFVGACVCVFFFLLFSFVLFLFFNQSFLCVLKSFLSKKVFV